MLWILAFLCADSIPAMDVISPFSGLKVDDVHDTTKVR